MSTTSSTVVLPALLARTSRLNPGSNRNDCRSKKLLWFSIEIDSTCIRDVVIGAAGARGSTGNLIEPGLQLCRYGLQVLQDCEVDRLVINGVIAMDDSIAQANGQSCLRYMLENGTVNACESCACFAKNLKLPLDGRAKQKAPCIVFEGLAQNE